MCMHIGVFKGGGQGRQKLYLNSSVKKPTRFLACLYCLVDESTCIHRDKFINRYMRRKFSLPDHVRMIVIPI